jgi:hypothetical protein
MITATGSLWRFNLFGEGVVSKGSDKSWVDKISLADMATTKSPITTTKNKDDPYFSGTAGFAYVDSSNNVMGTFQYFFNGDGYTDAKRKDLVKQGRQAITDASALTAVSGSDMSTQMNYMLKGLLSNSGQQYVGASLQNSKILKDKLTLGVLAIANASDLSGMVQPNATFQFFDGFSMALNPTFFWSTSALWGAGDDGEYVVVAGGPSVSLSFRATLGSGNF